MDGNPEEQKKKKKKFMSAWEWRDRAQSRLQFLIEKAH